MSSRKMIAVSEKTYHNLAELGNLEDSFDSVISRLIQKQKAASSLDSCQGAQG
jgi:predicted CopG family antitoxin